VTGWAGVIAGFLGGVAVGCLIAWRAGHRYDPAELTVVPLFDPRESLR
jgi:hypothetical protein